MWKQRLTFQRRNLLQAEIERNKPDVILLSAYLSHRKPVEFIAGIAARLGVPVLLGGPAFTLPGAAEDWARITGVSAVFSGEAEFAIVDLVRALISGVSVYSYPGIFVHSEKTFQIGCGSILEPLSELNELPIFDLACIAIGLLASRPIYITHHSFVVFNRGTPDRLIKIALPLLRRCKHIALCERMKLDLISAWNIGDANVAVLSNAALVRISTANLEVGAPSIQSVRRGAYHLGFIANLCAEKGLWTFLDTVGRLQAIGHTVVATIAGPIEPADALLEKELKQRLHAMKNISWLGAVHGRERTRFYQELDLLVFPTAYPNESEPLVILEALAHGVPVMTTPRGCIASSLADGNAVRVFPETSFVDDAVAAIDFDLQAIKPQSEREALAKQHYHHLREIGERQLKALIESVACLQQKDSSRH